jgi:3,4-dihydroxy 2-butanone 4-phosphate synthase/GTP cyclohydrolase II
VRPGHVFPLRARAGGVLVRTGQTEGSVDLARLAGLAPAGVICEVMNADGTMARRPELQRFARRHGLVLLSVADIIRYRLERERLVRRTGETTFERRGAGPFRAYAYTTDVDGSMHVALVKGELDGSQPVLTRVHRACLVGDLLGSTTCDCGAQLERAFQRIQEEGRGVVVYLQREGGTARGLSCTHAGGEEGTPGRADQGRLREFGVGAQILKDLGLGRLRLLTDNPKKIVGLESYALEVVEQVPLGGVEQTPRVAARRPRRRPPR